MTESPLNKLFAPLSDADTASLPTTKSATAKESDFVPTMPQPGTHPWTADHEKFKHPQLGQPVAVWLYRDATGAPEGYICRFNVADTGGNLVIDPDTGKQKKEFRPFRHGIKPGKGGKPWVAWHWKGWDANRPLYRLPEMVTASDKLVIITEGEKKADAVPELFTDAVGVSPMNGAQSPRKTDWTPLAGRRCIISTDNDEAGQTFGDAVYSLLEQAGAAEIMWLRPDRLGMWTVQDGELANRENGCPAKYDLADAVCDGFTADHVATLREDPAFITPYMDAAARSEARRLNGGHSEPKEKNSYVWPFQVSDNGVERRLELEDKTTSAITIEWRWFCSKLVVAAETRDNSGEDWGRLLEITDRDGLVHSWAMPMAMLAGDGSAYRERLLSLGLILSPVRTTREWLTEYISTARPGSKARCVDATGWHGTAYVTPGKVYGDNTGERVILQTSGVVAGFDCQGTLEGWKSAVAALAVGNSRLALALSAAFVGPLLYLVGEESHGFHFSGGSSSGKTTALWVAASAWGVPIHTWRTTDNAAEGLARSANDGLLLLDELSQVDGRAADAMAYMLGNGQGKGRMRKDGANRPIATWRLVFLSTGEVGLAEKISEVGKKAKAGQSVRLIEIPADAGAGLKLFDTLHGFSGGDALARHLRTTSEKHRGHAGRLFLGCVTKEPPALADALNLEKATWLAHHLPAGADGQVSRVAARFALAAAAGEMATEVGILPWPEGEASRAAAICFRAWLDQRGGVGSAETEAGLLQVRAFIEAHGMSRFSPIGADCPDGDPKTINRAGFRRKNEEGRWEYLVLPEAWKNEVCKGHDARAVARDLIARKMLVPGDDGKSSRSERIHNFGRSRVYLLSTDILEGGE